MTQEFLNEEKLPFKECSREQQHILLDALLDGKIQAWTNPLWTAVQNDTLLNYLWILRTKPVKRLAIPWEHIKPEYRWAAMDEYGSVFIYIAQPARYEKANGWVVGSNYFCLDFLNNIDIEGIDWRDSLVERPADK